MNLSKDNLPFELNLRTYQTFVPTSSGIFRIEHSRRLNAMQFHSLLIASLFVVHYETVNCLMEYCYALIVQFV